MLDTLYALGTWLNTTDAHFWARGLLRSASWVSPTVQSIHIVSMAVVIGTIGFIDLRMLGVAARSQSPAEMARRLMPWFWMALVLLFLTGAMLILNLPARYFDNIAFFAKVLLLVLGVALTLVLVRGLARGEDHWTTTPAKVRAARLIAGVSAAAWVGVVLAGRWIAYA